MADEYKVRSTSNVSAAVYDSNSNRMSVTRGGVTRTATYDEQDRIVTFGTKTYVHNDAGELVSVTDSSTTPASVTSYTYDVFGNLKSVTLPNNSVISYLLDGQNRRVGRKVGATLQKQFLWFDQLRPAAELNATGGIVAQFVYGIKGNVPDYIIKGSVRYKLMTDHLGSVVAVVHSTNGTIAQRIEYDEFGRVLSDTSPGFQPFGFAGGLYDPDTKLTLFGARSYDAETGRFMSKDPILFAGGDTNLYGYVMNDPVNLIDPSGLTAQDVANAISYIRARNPNYVSHNTSYGALGGDSGRASPRRTPFGTNDVLLDNRFLGPLDRDGKWDLLNTLFHENLHLQDGFWGTTFYVLTGGGDSRHMNIGIQSDQFANDNIDNFACGNR